MTLTPQQVRDKQFNTVKMRTGYDMDEVDSFLDEVESALGSLIVENDDLRAQLAQKPAAPVTSSEAEKKLAEAEKKAAEAEKKLGDAQAKLTDAEKKAAEADKKLAEATEREKAAETKLTEARRMATANTVAPAATSATRAGTRVDSFWSNRLSTRPRMVTSSDVARARTRRVSSAATTSAVASATARRRDASAG